MARLKIFTITCVILIGVLACLLYTPMPEGLEDPFRAMVFMAGWKLIMTYPQYMREYLGQGRYLDNLIALQPRIYREGDFSPITSWFSELNVTRATIEGVPVIVYKPWSMKENELRPGFVYFHCGGWIAGSADKSDKTVYDFALCTGAVTINVDYRRAPQEPFPAAFDDAVAVTRYILRHGREFGIDVSRVGVGGSSAGGNLAAATAFHIAKTPSDLPRLKYQVLLHPALQGFSFRLPSHIEYSELFPLLYTKDIAAFVSIYLGLGGRNGDLHGTIMMEDRHLSPEFRTKSKYAEYIDEKNLPEKYRTPKRTPPTVSEPYNATVFHLIKDLIVDPRFSPLMADDLSGLPAAMIVAQNFDVLRDDGLLYAKRLRDFGVETVVHEGKGYHADHMRHAMESIQARTGIKANKDICDFIRKIAREN